jgi:hypothetical protein
LQHIERFRANWDFSSVSAAKAALTDIKREPGEAQYLTSFHVVIHVPA